MKARSPLMSMMLGAILLLGTDGAQAYLVSEGFDYSPNQPLNGLNGGSNWGGAWNGTNTPFIGNGSLDFPGLPETGNKAVLPSDASTYNIFRALGQPVNETVATSATLGFLFSLTGDPGQVGVRFSGLSLFSGASEQVFFGKPGNTSEVGFHTYAGGEQIFGADAAFSASTVFLFEAVITFNPSGNDTMNVTIRDNGVFNQTWSSISLGNNFQFDSVRLNRDFALSNSVNSEFDEISITVVPEPSASLLVLTGLVVTLFRRSKRAR